ncbi:MAG: hypothetical protein KBD37_10290 [Burkholderiales bacterium]|nr:hypothetical protein [Burkholderiales bacterium]
MMAHAIAIAKDKFLSKPYCKLNSIVEDATVIVIKVSIKTIMIIIGNNSKYFI